MSYAAALDPSGDLPVRNRLVTGLDQLTQRLGPAIGLHLGEWFADPREGLPWTLWHQQRPPDVVGIGAAIRLRVEAVPGVVRVDEWAGTFDVASRALVFSATIRTVSGDASLTVTSAAAVDNGFPAVALLGIRGASVLTR